jgi:cyanate lyase
VAQEWVSRGRHVTHRALDRQADPKRDRVTLSMTGKFLPFKYYGATGNELAYGLKEE